MSACRSAQPVVVGFGRSGVLGQGDCQLQSGEYADRWRLDLSSGRTVQIDVESFDFDTYVIVTDLQGRVIAQDDDGGTDFNAHLVLALNAGSYIVWATSARPGQAGAYDLWVQ